MKIEKLNINNENYICIKTKNLKKFFDKHLKKFSGQNDYREIDDFYND